MRFASLAALVLLAACGIGSPAVIDGSSQAAYRESLDAVRADLTPAERAKFEAALKIVQASAFAKSDSRAEMQARVRTQLAGKTAQTVIEEATARQRDIADAAVDQVFRIKKEVRDEIRNLEAEAAN